MVSDNRNTVIHRKARVAREEYQARAMSAVKALRLSVAQTAAELFGLSLTVATVEQVQIAQSDVGPAFKSRGLIVLLDGPNDNCGAIQLDDVSLAALIEIQTTGQFLGRPPEDRDITRTDAAIAAPLIDATLTRFEEHIQNEEPDHWGSGYRFGAMIDDVRNLCLALSAPEFHLFKLNVEIGDAAIPGAMTLLFPVQEFVSVQGADHVDAEKSMATLEQSALDAPVVLQAVLARTTVTLERICTLRVGDQIPFSTDQPLIARLEAGGKFNVSKARVGQLNGLRAVRLVASGEEKGAVVFGSETKEPVSGHVGQTLANIDGVAVGANFDVGDLTIPVVQGDIESTVVEADLHRVERSAEEPTDA